MRKKDTIRLTILMGTCNRLPLLRQCLPFLIKTRVPFQLIILDAGSTDGTINYIKKEYPKIILFEDNKKRGQAKSFNKVLKTIKTDYVCWLSDDNLVKKGMLSKAVKILDDNPKIGMIGLKVKDVMGPWTNEPYIGGIWPSGILNVNQGMVRMSVLKCIKYFDIAYPDYGIDADLTTKILLLGYLVAYSKDVVILHYRDYSSFPGVFVTNDRAKRLKKALNLYRVKYRNLKRKNQIKSDIKKYDFLLKIILRFFYFITRLSILNTFVYLHTGYNRRDFHNVLHAKFVSKLDLWYNRKKPYYLVQFIPEKLRT